MTLKEYPEWNWEGGAYLTRLGDQVLRVTMRGTGMITNTVGFVCETADLAEWLACKTVWSLGFVELVDATNDPDAVRRKWEELQPEIPERLMEEIL